ncbi:bifunctional 4-hydroxy-2-oxoglutarate aldolase/2-dehydro-3-deoxy-phosphogluconate aldolase [Sphingobacterium sp. SGG-5]|uniref:bifunctional 4-hydroxy-2-oxoglutarate aldolase/2-dehydro-3-deoxy-phosphogluconate aldolase n=1 Tax=Sphingobacterium sp. SGG-5 TaxID=2710881 RepID=UPI0013EAF8BD|nr:bifunctional 4-hydroxy-2-oxoglutarate aldolase/2-dehydro-3-deoxy-phosphogluconate aldolase [Sphingobacterium sp. SGG-5]NGM60867.1 bifunctional 4-hydroxy-2-oxoglutarate aldolase/2-dehydro-3-deoxy-phosphogluconate aldolase [Sphingobacterium sp. SGG-5]
MSNNRNSFNRALFDQLPVVGILRDVSLEDAMMILPLFIEAGFTTVEVPINSEGAEKLIQHLAQHFGEKLNIGAGTVIDLSDLDRALAAGSGFIVTPVVDEQVIESCVDKGISVFPGALTPTEIVKAWKLGATMVKVFPADEMGPRYIKALKAPLKHIKLLPTGGISVENANDYFLAGAEGIGVSTGLFKSELIRNKDWQGLREHLLSFRRIIGDRRL